MFSDRLRHLREDAGLKQIDIAKKLNLSGPAYGHYERGTRDPNLDTLISISKFYNVTTDYLLGISDITLSNNSSNIESEDVTSTYSETEIELIHYYRNLNHTDQQWIIGQAIDLDKKAKNRESEKTEIDLEQQQA